MTLSASRASLAFGDLEVGQSSARTVTITNTGNEDVTISAASITGMDFSIVVQPPYPDVLNPNATAEFTVKFAPATATRIANGLLTIASNATNSPITVVLTGSPSDPRQARARAMIFSNDGSLGIGVILDVLPLALCQGQLGA